MKRAVFLDRDGVINRKAPEGQYIANRSELVLLPGVLSAARSLCEAGFVIFVVTNQRGIARRLVNAEEIEGLHNYLLQLFSVAGAPIARIYVCPHESGCACRKPAPGMLLQAAVEYSITLHSSWIVGDSSTDILAGKRAGCRTALIQSTVIGSVDVESPDLRAKDLSHAVRLILEAEGVPLRGSVQTRSNA